ncbi:MAG TPA: type I-C CRISPR-associated protein Cas8c/Csd1 [Thermomicrobiales bacterium]|nr:type I-C CRISPR-associated protein Cas8c/Csd1 [Thermomicrobiales bacterium]
MLLQRLKEYAESGRVEEMAPPGYVETPIRYMIELDGAGRLLGVVDQGEEGSARVKAGKRMFAPTVVRTVGVKAKLLADIGEYVLGIARDPAKQERVDRAHRAFVELVHDCASATREPAVLAVQAFLDGGADLGLHRRDDYDPGMVATFRVDGVLPIDLPSVCAFWAGDGGEGDGDEGGAPADGVTQCLVCGELRPPVRVLAYKWKGIPGGQTAGLALISANAPAFESYGLEQSLIAPTCAGCGELFSKAANDLLANDSTRVRIGPTAFIFWTREPVPYNFGTLLTDPTTEQAKAVTMAANSGQREVLRINATRFYAAALSASGSRVVVRDWLDTALGEVLRHLARYFQFQEIVGLDGTEAPPLKLVALAGATVRELKDLTARTTQTLLSVALGGRPVPKGLLFEAVRRCRAEGAVSRPQAALIKMVLLSERERQEGRASVADQELVRLNPGNRDPAYLCGRLLAVLEATQRAALGDINATIVDRYFGTASSAPASVFGKLIRGAQPHLSRLRRDRPGTYAALQQRLEEAQAGLRAFPPTLTLTEQGLFALGYYHQRAADRAAAAAARARRDRQLAADLNPDAAEQGGHNQAAE